MPASFLSSGASILLSLALEWIPGLNGWWAGVSKNAKRLIMLFLMLGVGLGVYALSCVGANFFGFTLTCDEPGFTLLMKRFGEAVIASQATFLLAPKPREK